MKLNLLPTTVKKSAQSRGAYFVAALIAAGCIALAALMVISSGKERKDAVDRVASEAG